MPHPGDLTGDGLLDGQARLAIATASVITCAHPFTTLPALLNESAVLSFHVVGISARCTSGL